MTKNRFRIPKVRFINTPELQANYLCFLASQIQEGVYQKHGFAVLPYPTNHPQAVYFPDLPYTATLWKSLKRSPHQSVARLFPQRARSEIEKFVPKASQIPLPSDWKKRERLFFNVLKEMRLFQEELAKIALITVLLTPYGTAGSFHYLLKKSGKVDLFITHRENNPIGFLAETLILSLLLIQNPRYAFEKWQEKQTIADFLFSQTKLVTLSPKQSLKQTNRLPTKYLLASQKYLQKLGFGEKKKFTIKNDQIFYGEKRADRILSFQEKKVLTGLIAKNGEILTHDQLAQILWGKGAAEKFSLWAITKVVQKLRVKLQTLGVSSSLISTFYGKGYTLAT
jgi:hypothetical protein